MIVLQSTELQRRASWRSRSLPLWKTSWSVSPASLLLPPLSLEAQPPLNSSCCPRHQRSHLCFPAILTGSRWRRSFQVEPETFRSALQRTLNSAARFLLCSFYGCSESEGAPIPNAEGSCSWPAAVLQNPQGNPCSPSGFHLQLQPTHGNNWKSSLYLIQYDWTKKQSEM